MIIRALLSVDYPRLHWHLHRRRKHFECEGPGVSTVRARAQNFKPRPLINGNAFVTLMAKMKKQRWIIGKNSRFQGEQQRN